MMNHLLPPLPSPSRGERREGVRIVRVRQGPNRTLKSDFFDGVSVSSSDMKWNSPLRHLQPAIHMEASRATAP